MGLSSPGRGFLLEGCGGIHLRKGLQQGLCLDSLLEEEASYWKGVNGIHLRKGLCKGLLCDSLLQEEAFYWKGVNGTHRRKGQKDCPDCQV